MMKPPPVTKYRAFPEVHLPGGQWPSRTIQHTLIWCSVDLPDGNQGPAQSMSVDEKSEYFEMLVRIGFQEIEIGFPSFPTHDFRRSASLV